MRRALPVPALIRSPRHEETVREQREQVGRILTGRDDRLLVISGPCSAHDSDSIVDYVAGLTDIAGEHARDLYVVARVYTEKPRSRIGWPGMLLDPYLDAGYQVGYGIESARAMLETVAGFGMPIACEFVEPLLAFYLADLVCWGAIGARTVESPPHRRLASALDMPIGFKNRADGAISPAVDAIAAAAVSQPVITMDDNGIPQWWVSPGNPRGHLVLRGGESGPNHTRNEVDAALAELKPLDPQPRLIIDFSHGNSGKDYRRQAAVAADVGSQIAGGQHGIAGVMVESFVHDGAQPHSTFPEPGLSITDSCIGLPATAAVLAELAEAVRHRRRVGTTNLMEVS